MGESSPKSMRGAGMDDVIFAGTAIAPGARLRRGLAAGRARGRATCPATSRLAPVGDVEVTRRIERGAGSAYRVNGRDVRAKDVALLFADAATGAHSPALVSQGKISAVIAAKPTERRLMLEEAAGIAGLHVRRKDAEQKLRAAEANLTRLDEVLADMELRASALRRQAQGGRALPQALRPDPDRRGAADLRPLARGGRGGRSRRSGRPRPPTAAVEKAAEAQRAAAAWQTRPRSRLADQRAAAQAARDRATALGHQLADACAPSATASRRRIARARRAPHAPWPPTATREAALGEDAKAALARLDAGGPRHRRPARRGREPAAARSTSAPSSWRTRRATPKPRSARPAPSRRPSRPRRGSPRPRSKSAQREARPRRGGEPRGSPSRWPGSARKRRLVDTLAGGARAAREAAEARLEAGRRGDRRRRGDAASRPPPPATPPRARRVGRARRARRARIRGQGADQGGRGRRAATGRSTMSRPSPAMSARSPPRSATISTPRSTATAPRRWTGADAAARRSARLPAGAASRSPTMSRRRPPCCRRLEQIGVAERDEGIALAVGQRLVTRDGRLRRWDGFVATGLGAAAAERLIRVNRLAEIETRAARRRARRSRRRERAHRRGAAPRWQAARDAADAARRAEAEAGAAIREAGRAEDMRRGRDRAARPAPHRPRRARRAGRRRISPRRSGRSPRPRRVAAALPDAAATEARVAELRADGRARAAGARRGPRRGGDPCPRGQRRQAARRGRAQGAGRLAGPRRRGRQAPRRHSAARIAEAEAEARAARRRARDARRPDRGAERRGRPPPPRPPRPPPRHERAGEDALRETEARLAEAGEALAAAREARAGAAARAEKQEARRIEMARISGESFECPPPLLPEKIGFDEAAIDAGRRGIGAARAADRRSASGSARSTSSPSASSTELEESRARQPGRARGAGPRHPPPARLDRQPQPRGPRPAAHRLRGRSTAISAACSPPCSRAARPISSWSNRTIRSRPGSRSWRSRPASASPRSPCSRAASRR